MVPTSNNSYSRVEDRCSARARTDKCNYNCVTSNDGKEQAAARENAKEDST